MPPATVILTMGLTELVLWYDGIIWQWYISVHKQHVCTGNSATDGCDSQQFLPVHVMQHIDGWLRPLHQLLLMCR